MIISGVIGLTTFLTDLSGAFRSFANWIDAGGRIDLILWTIIILLGLWVLFDVITWIVEYRKSQVYRNRNRENERIFIKEASHTTLTKPDGTTEERTS